jgi:hypothetical protein
VSGDLLAAGRFLRHDPVKLASAIDRLGRGWGLW